MERFDIDCQQDDCGVRFEAQVPVENCEKEAGHAATCPACGTKTYFEVAREWVVDDTSFALDDDL